MDPLVYIVIALLVVALFVSRTSAKNDRIDGATARTLVGEGAFLLDVRTPGEFQTGHIRGAVNIPVQELGRRLSEVPSGKAVVVYCRSGMRSATAARMLSSQGRDVHDLGPMSAW